MTPDIKRKKKQYHTGLFQCSLKRKILRNILEATRWTEGDLKRLKLRWIMKINKVGLHPLYDQYSNEENRLTHALLHTIGSSEWLFSRFLKKIIGVNTSIVSETFEISTQKVPFSHGDSDLETVESIPDAWIIDRNSNLGIAIEVKDKRKSLSLNQLSYHSSRIRNYKHPYILVITPDIKRPREVIELEKEIGGSLNVIWRSWDEIYRWLTELPITRTNQRNKEKFLITSMREYLERRREILGFQGIYFRAGFNVLEAKTILNAEMEELEPTVKMLYKDLNKRRSSITTISPESVWDCFGSEMGFTADLHITLSINGKAHDISITVPSSARKAWSRLKIIFSNAEHEEQLFSILHALRKKVPHLFIEFIQRHYIARKRAVVDGFMEFDIDTLGLPFRKKESKTKEFPIWLPAIRSAILNKKNVNAQIKFNSRVFLTETKDIEKPKFIDTATAAIMALKPLYDFLRKSA